MSKTKLTLLFFAIFIAATAGGVLTSAALVSHYSQVAWANMLKLLENDNQFNHELTSKMALHYAELAEEKNYERILYWACRELSMNVQYIEPDNYVENMRRHDELEAFVENATKKQKALEVAGHCDEK